VSAILPVHVFGLPCEMTPIMEVARTYSLRVIEDACEALGARYNGRHVGTFGDVGVFAFYPNKQMTTGEGGMIVTDDDRTAALCRSMRNQGRAPGREWLQHVRLGYNYRLSDVHSALGLAQLERLDDLLRGRARVAALYERALGGHPHIKLPACTDDRHRSWFAYPIQLSAGTGEPSLRDRVLAALRARGVACQAYFPAIHLQPYMRDGYRTAGPLPSTETASNTCLTLPMFSSATEEQIAYVCKALLEILEQETRGAGNHILRIA
jgi:perosamine synthetase